MRNKKISVILAMSLLINNLPILAEESIGWNNNNGTWSYIKEDGTKAIGWIKDGDCWYAFNNDGIMRTGWIASNEHWYFMGESGVMQADAWVEDNGASYYIKGTGIMAKDYVKDGYELTSDGKAIPLSDSNSVVLNDTSALEGKIVEGNLYVDVTTAKELELKGVTVKGKLVIIGDNKTSGKITLTDSKIETINAQSRNAEVVLSGKTEVKKLVMEETLVLNADKSFNNKIALIEIQSTAKNEVVITVPTDKVTTRSYAALDVQSPVGTLLVQQASEVKVNNEVKNLVVSETATGSTINVAKDVVIENVDVKADTAIKGEGKVENVSGDQYVTDSTTKEEEKHSAGGSGGGGGGSTTITPVLSIAESDMSLHIGDVIQLNASVKPASSNQTITWQSSNTAVAEVDANGLVTVKGLGTSTITAKDTYGNTASITIIGEASLTPYIEKNTIVVGGQMTPYFDYTPTSSEYVTLDWCSDDTDIVKYQAGAFVAKKVGTTQIRGKAQDGSGLELIQEIEVIDPKSSVDVSKMFSDSHFSTIENKENPFVFNRVFDKEWIKSSTEGVNNGASKIEFTVTGKGYLLFDCLKSFERLEKFLVQINDKTFDLNDGIFYRSFIGVEPETFQFKLPLDVNKVSISYQKDDLGNDGFDAVWLNNFRYVDENSSKKYDVKVHFNQENGNITLKSDGNPDGIAIKDNEAYKINLSDKVTLKIELKEGKAFLGWYQDGTLYSDKNEISFNLKKDMNLEARIDDYTELLKNIVQGDVEISSVNNSENNGYEWTISAKILDDENHYALIPNEIGSDSKYENLVLKTKGSGILSFDYKTNFSESGSYLMLDTSMINDKALDKKLLSNNAWKTYTMPYDSDAGTINSLYLAYTHTNSETGQPAIKNVKFIQGKATIDFSASDNSLGTVSATDAKGSINSGSELSVGNHITFKASASQNALFMGWIDDTGEIVTREESYSTMVTDSIKIQALFVDRDAYAARIGSQLFTSLEDAVASEIEGNIVLMKDITLYKNLIIPEGKTLVIPYMEGDLGYDARNESKPVYNPDGTVKDTMDHKELYLTLKVPENITMEVQGTLIINAITGRASAGYFEMDNTGGYGLLDLNGELLISGNGIVDVAGFVKGNGKVLVKENGVLRDLYVVKNWRGGTQASHVLGKSVYPMNEADCQNVEASIVLEGNAKYIGIVKMFASYSYYKTRFPLIDRNNGLMRLNENSKVEILRNDDLTRTTFDISGGGSASSSTLKILYFTVSTGSYLYPIDGDTTYKLSDGIYTFENDFKFLTGSELYVNNAEVVLNEGKTLVFYDKFNDVPNTSTTYPERLSAFIHLAASTTFKINGKFAGDIKIDYGADQENPVIIETGQNAKFMVTTKEANGYKEKETEEDSYVVELEFKALVNGEAFAFDTGKYYEFFYDNNILMVKVDGTTKSVVNYQTSDILNTNTFELSDIVE